MSMPYAIVLRDAPGSAAPRREHLSRHLEFVERVIDRILVAGPLSDPATGAQTGSLYVLDVPDFAAARALLESDPYYAAAVWNEITIEPFSAAAGTWVGGLAWKKR
jgi:uncharacterized protein YciI